MQSISLYNSQTRKVEELTPVSGTNEVTIYNCGPTVYKRQHIGNMRRFLNADFLKRTLELLEYSVKDITNITDVGHLTQDEIDEGEDKLEKEAREKQKTPQDIAREQEALFFQDIDALSIKRSSAYPRATEHVQDMITLIETLIKKGHAYVTQSGVYFDVTSFPNYGKLSGNTLDALDAGHRVAVQTDKKHPADFALWMLDTQHIQLWDSPWGKGYPGWHIECSAMSMKYLGETIDIHTGGIEHTAVHHPNEIAQSEGATGKQFVRFWVHYGHLMIDGAKMSKSLGNIFSVDDVIAKQFDPLALRYFYLTSSYSKPMNFTWEALGGAQNALEELREHASSIKRQAESKDRTQLSEEKLEKVDAYREKFNEALANDLNTPQALAVVWEVAKSNIPSQDKLDLLLDFDEVLGLGLARESRVKSKKTEIPEEIQRLLGIREKLRKEKKFAEADAVRKEIEAKGFILEDTPEGTKITPC